jgi:hypothetical protein
MAHSSVNCPKRRVSTRAFLDWIACPVVHGWNDPDRRSERPGRDRSVRVRPPLCGPMRTGLRWPPVGCRRRGLGRGRRIRAVGKGWRHYGVEHGRAAKVRRGSPPSGSSWRALDSTDLLSAGNVVTPLMGHGTEYDLPVPTLAAAQDAQAFVDARIAEGQRLHQDHPRGWACLPPRIHSPIRN